MNKPATCNNCRKICARARSPLAITMEKTQRLKCFTQPNTKHFKFTDLVSKVTIVNPNNPVIKWLGGY